MRILTSLFGGSAVSTIRQHTTRLDQELPMRELYQLLWAYYYNNGLYDDLRAAGYNLTNTKLKEIYNPAFRAVEFFVDTVWPGTLEDAHPLIVDGQPGVKDAITQIWKWSNWEARKQVAVRYAAVTGNLYLRIARPIPRNLDQPAPERVYIQLIRPQFVVEQETDERDYITYARLDIPQVQGHGKHSREYIHTEVWDPERLRIWYHTKPDRETDSLGQPDYEVTLDQWGLDFVPLVQAKLIDVGEPEGAGAFTLTLSKINELNNLASRLHQLLFRHNDVTWALQSNMVDNTGRPIPAPRIRSSSAPGASQEADSLELGGEKFLQLPGMSSLTPLIPNLQYADHLAAVTSQMEEIERDLPQLSYYKLKDLPEMSGKALRLMLQPALAKALEVRGNLDQALIRANMIALTVGSSFNAFDGLKVGTFENGDFEHRFAQRPAIPMTREEIAELAQKETAAGIPLVTSLRESGWTEERLARLEEDQQAQQAAQQATFASALLNAQDQMAAGEQSTGLDQPGGGGVQESPF